MCRAKRLLWWVLDRRGIQWVRNQLLGLAYWLDPAAYPMTEAQYQAHMGKRVAERPRFEAMHLRHDEVRRWMESTFDDIDHRERLVAVMEATVATFRAEERLRKPAQG